MKDKKRRLTQSIADMLFLLGGVAVAAGIGMIFLPAGIIAGGTLMATMGLLIGRGDADGDR